jgi:hypothetical protein
MQKRVKSKKKKKKKKDPKFIDMSMVGAPNTRAVAHQSSLGERMG